MSVKDTSGRFEVQNKKIKMMDTSLLVLTMAAWCKETKAGLQALSLCLSVVVVVQFFCFPGKQHGQILQSQGGE